MLFGSCLLILFVSSTNSIQIVRRQCCLGGGVQEEEEEEWGPDCKWLPTQTWSALVRWTRVQQGPQVTQQMHSYCINCYCTNFNLHGTYINLIKEWKSSQCGFYHLRRNFNQPQLCCVSVKISCKWGLAGQMKQISLLCSFIFLSCSYHKTHLTNPYNKKESGD